MKLSCFRPAIIALLCSSTGLLHADIVVLKDGKRLEGSITAENPTAIHMRYKLTAKIWDDKDIPRTDIAEIIKQTPQEVEVIELRKVLPTADLMTAEKYEHVIQDRLRPFVNRYPGTPEAAEVEKMVAQLQEEKEKVVAGGTKMEGKWLAPDEAKAQSYNVKAYDLYNSMHEKAVAKEYTAAMKIFDKFTPQQGGYLASVYYPKAVEEAIAILTNFEAQVEQMIKDQPTLTKMRDDGVKKLVEPDLSRTKNAIAREKEQWKTGYDLERKASRWFTPYKYDLSTLKSLSTTIVTEKSRLKSIDTATIGKLNEAISRIMTANAKASKDPESLNAMRDAIFEGEAGVAALDQMQQMFYQQIFQGYRQLYMAAHQQMAARNAQAAMAPGAIPAAGGSAALGGGAGAPTVDDRVAAALAAASGKAPPAPAAGAAPAPGAPGAMPVTGAPGTPGVAPAVAPGTVPVAPAGYPQQPAVAPTPGVPQQPGVAPYGAAVPPQQQPAVAPAAAPVEVSGGIAGLSTNALIFIGIGVVVLVLVVAMSGGKKKK